jgi:hypothetical protein
MRILGIMGRKRIPVIQMTMDDIIIKEFECCKDAAIGVGGNEEAIRLCCIGKSKTSKGFKWKYKKND